MNDTQIVITVAYTFAVLVSGVAFALVLRSTRARRVEQVDEGRLAHMEGRWGAAALGDPG